MSTVVLGRAYEKSAKIMMDPVPNLRSAGHQIVGVGERESADYNIRADMQLITPGTPDQLKKYRKSHVNLPGKIQKHWGHAEDAPHFAANYSYGKGTYQSEHVSNVIKANNLAGMQEKFNDAYEQKYASAKREPLGKSYSRQYDWP